MVSIFSKYMNQHASAWPYFTSPLNTWYFSEPIKERLDELSNLSYRCWEQAIRWFITISVLLTFSLYNFNRSQNHGIVLFLKPEKKFRWW